MKRRKTRKVRRVRRKRRNLRGNPMSYHVGGLSSRGARGEARSKARYSKTLPNKFYKIYWSHHSRGDTAGLVFKGDKLLKLSMSELSRFWPSSEGLKMERIHIQGPFDSWDEAFKPFSTRP